MIERAYARREPYPQRRVNGRRGIEDDHTRHEQAMLKALLGVLAIVHRSARCVEVARGERRRDRDLIHGGTCKLRVLALAVRPERRSVGVEGVEIVDAVL